jgi:hypothetical protein
MVQSFRWGELAASPMGGTATILLSPVKDLISAKT